MMRHHHRILGDGKAEGPIGAKLSNDILYMNQEKISKYSRRDFSLSDNEDDESFIEYLRKEQNLNEDAFYDYIKDLARKNLTEQRLRDDVEKNKLVLKIKGIKKEFQKQ